MTETHLKSRTAQRALTLGFVTLIAAGSTLGVATSASAAPISGQAASLSPATGLDLGPGALIFTGDKLAYNGIGFDACSVIRVDGVAQETQLLSATQLGFTAPDHATGTIEVSVGSTCGGAETAALPYPYVEVMSDPGFPQPPVSDPPVSVPESPVSAVPQPPVSDPMPLVIAVPLTVAGPPAVREPQAATASVIVAVPKGETPATPAPGSSTKPAAAAAFEAATGVEDPSNASGALGLTALFAGLGLLVSSRRRRGAGI